MVRRDVFLDDSKPVAHLKNHGRIHDVLGGGAPVDKASGVAALLHKLMNEGKNRIADDIGFLAQEIEIKGLRIASLGYLFRRFRRNDAAARLGFRERDLHFDIARYEGEVREDVAHAWSTEGVAKQD